MPEAEDGVLALDGRVDAGAAPRLHAQWAGRAGRLRVIDLEKVERIDSAGVALVHELLARADAEVELRNVPERFEQVCRAHRIGLRGGERNDAHDN